MAAFFFRARYASEALLLNLTLVLISSLSSVEASQYSYFCDFNGVEVVTLELQSNGEYRLPSGQEVALGDFDDGGCASAPTASIDDGMKKPATIGVRKCPCWNPKFHQYDNNTTDVYLAQHFYCPVDLSHCGFFEGDHYGLRPPACFSVGDHTTFARSIWPMLIISYAFLTTFLLCSRSGRNALGFCSKCVMPEYNHRLVNRIIEQQPSTANTIILRSLREEQEQRELAAPPPEQAAIQTRQQQQPWRVWRYRIRRNNEFVLDLGPDEWALLLRDPATLAVMEMMDDRLNDNDAEPVAPTPTSLKLRTKVYHSRKNDILLEDEGLRLGNENVDNDIELAPLSNKQDGNVVIGAGRRELENAHKKHHSRDCTICYSPVNDGDRVGALPSCNHIFHVDCLKVWLARRNVCPLCLSEGIATPQFDA